MNFLFRINPTISPLTLALMYHSKQHLLKSIINKSIIYNISKLSLNFSKHNIYLYTIRKPQSLYGINL